MEKIGSRAKVMHGTAEKTSGGLKRSDLKYNKFGKIVSKKASNSAKKNNNLVRAGYTTQKGIFGTILKGGANKKENNSKTNENTQKKIQRSQKRNEVIEEISKNKNMTSDVQKLFDELIKIELENKQDLKTYKTKLEKFLERTGMSHIEWIKCINFQKKEKRKKLERIERIKKEKNKKN